MLKGVKVLIIIISVLLMAGCATSNSNNNSELTSEKKKETEGYNIIGGEWVVSGVYKDDKIIDLSDPKYAALKDLYDSHMLTINEDGSFVLKENIFFIKGEYSQADSEEGKYSYLLKAAESYQTVMENGEFTKKNERKSDEVYLVKKAEEVDELEFCEYDVSTKAVKPDKTRFLMKRRGEEDKESEGNRDNDVSNEYESYKLEYISFDIPKDWDVEESEEKGKKTTSSSFKSQKEGVVINFLLLHSSDIKVDSESKAEQLLDTYLNTLFGKNNYKDLSTSEFQWEKNPSRYGHCFTGDSGVGTDIYCFMVNLEDILFVISGKVYESNDRYSERLDHIVNSLDMPEYHPGSVSSDRQSSDETYKLDINKNSDINDIRKYISQNSEDICLKKGQGGYYDTHSIPSYNGEVITYGKHTGNATTKDISYAGDLASHTFALEYVDENDYYNIKESIEWNGYFKGIKLDISPDEFRTFKSYYYAPPYLFADNGEKVTVFDNTGSVITSVKGTVSQ